MLCVTKQAAQRKDPAVTMFIGPSMKAVPLEIGVVSEGWWTR
jgi:hypothetical protein